MSKRLEHGLPEDFPEELLQVAKSLEAIGIDDLAWDCENAQRVLDYLYNREYMILGGDVYKLVDGSLESTIDSWYTNKDETQAKEQILLQARNRAKSYIAQYRAGNGDSFFYSIVFVAG